jgi:hypothetical protein
MRNLIMETSTHSQGDQSEAKVQHGVNATWIYHAGHEDEGDEEEEWDSPQVASTRKDVWGASEQEDKKEEEGDSKTGEVHRESTDQNCLQTLKDIKDDEGFDIPGDDGKTLERRSGEKHVRVQRRSSISGQVCLQTFKDINDDKGFDISGDDGKTLERRSGEKHVRAPRRSSISCVSGEKHVRAQRRSSISGEKHVRAQRRSSISNSLDNLNL